MHGWPGTRGGRRVMRMRRCKGCWCLLSPPKNKKCTRGLFVSTEQRSSCGVKIPSTYCRGQNRKEEGSLPGQCLHLQLGTSLLSRPAATHTGTWLGEGSINSQVGQQQVLRPCQHHGNPVTVHPCLMPSTDSPQHGVRSSQKEHQLLR